MFGYIENALVILSRAFLCYLREIERIIMFTKNKFQYCIYNHERLELHEIQKEYQKDKAGTKLNRYGRQRQKARGFFVRRFAGQVFRLLVGEKRSVDRKSVV